MKMIKAQSKVIKKHKNSSLKLFSLCAFKSFVKFTLFNLIFKAKKKIAKLDLRLGIILCKIYLISEFMFIYSHLI